MLSVAAFPSRESKIYRQILQHVITTELPRRPRAARQRQNARINRMKTVSELPIADATPRNHASLVSLFINIQALCYRACNNKKKKSVNIILLHLLHHIVTLS